MLLDIVITILFGALLILLAIAAFKLLRAAIRAVRGSPAADQLPGLEAVLAALEPWVFRAILAGERAVLWGFEEIDVKLAGIDKKQVADSVYALLPDVILVGTRPVPVSFVKALVTPQVFEGWIKSLYDQADAFIEQNKQYLHDQVERLKVEGEIELEQE